MKVTADITHHQITALLARQLKVEPGALTLATDEHGEVSAHVVTDSKGLRAIERRIDKAMGEATGDGSEPAGAEVEPS